MKKRIKVAEPIGCIEPFKPRLAKQQHNHACVYACGECYYGLPNRCGKYDSPLPKGKRGDAICWRPLS